MATDLEEKKEDEFLPVMDDEEEEEAESSRKRKKSPDDDDSDHLIQNGITADDHEELNLDLSLNSSVNSRVAPPPPPVDHLLPQQQAVPDPLPVVVPFQEWRPINAIPPFYVDPLAMHFPQPNQFFPVAAAAPPPPAELVINQEGFGFGFGYGFGGRYGSRLPPVPPEVRPPRRTRPRNPMTRRQPPNKKDGDDVESETVPAPYPWATDRRATIRQYNELITAGIHKITGQVKCKNCLQQYELEYDLVDKFHQVGNYLAQNRDAMRDRAPEKWKNPVLPTCRICNQENSVKPIIVNGENNLDSINWLFLLLGEMIGLCTLEQLRYLCKNTKIHRTGAKDRLVYGAYLTLCHQLDPNGPFHFR